MAIGTQKSNAIAALDTGLVQGTCKTAGAVGELPVSKVLLIADHRSSARILLLRVAKETQGGERNVHSAPRPGSGGLTSIDNKSVSGHKI